MVEDFCFHSSSSTNGVLLVSERISYLEVTEQCQIDHTVLVLVPNFTCGLLITPGLHIPRY